MTSILSPGWTAFQRIGTAKGPSEPAAASSTLKMTEMILVYVQNGLLNIRLLQAGLLHLQAAAFQQLIGDVARDIYCQ